MIFKRDSELQIEALRHEAVACYRPALMIFAALVALWVVLAFAVAIFLALHVLLR